MLLAGAVVAAGVLAAPPGGGATPLANRCVTIKSSGRFIVLAGSGYRASARSIARAATFYVKLTGLRTYLLSDARGQLLSAAGNRRFSRASVPGPRSEWTASRVPFTLVPASHCRPFPEAQVGASGRPLTGPRPGRKVFGFVDAHLHITANMRAGGLVIYGEPFDRFGIVAALGHDANDHGADGRLDYTGNLLRSGTPVGTHDTHGWPTFAGWPTYNTQTHQQTYYVWLERVWRAGERLVVAQTVDDEPLCRLEPRRTGGCNETRSITAQVRELKALQDYVDAQSGGRG
jgi:hypothetical protein